MKTPIQPTSLQKKLTKNAEFGAKHNKFLASVKNSKMTKSTQIQFTNNGKTHIKGAASSITGYESNKQMN